MSQNLEAASTVTGVLLLDKPSGATSNAALQRVKRMLGAAKAGHVGTLDPMANGLLPICLGEATKFSGFMLAADKTYLADVLLGATSNTGDAEGEITSRNPVAVTLDHLESAIAKFRGPIMQTPPMYSAIKRGGKPLYAYARAGQVVEIAPRPVTIHALILVEYREPLLRLSVRCSKGTYIRVLAEDIGRELGCGAMLAGLRREAVGCFDLSAAVTIDGLELMELEKRREILKPPDSLVSELPAVRLDGDAERLLSTGRRVLSTENQGLHRLYGSEGRFLGLGEVLNGELIPKRLMSGNFHLSGNTGGVPQATKIA